MKSPLDEEPLDGMTPIEDTLYIHVRKICARGKIKLDNEYPIGRFRLDLITENGFGFEADGKEFHKDKDRDIKRDQWILENAARYRSNLHTIVRIPGFLLWNHEFAIRCIVADILGVEWPLECDVAYNVEESFNESYKAGEFTSEQFEAASCFGKCDSYYAVGNPLAFLSRAHPFLSAIEYEPKYQRVGVVEVRRLSNVANWNPHCDGFFLGWRRRHES